MAAITKHDDGYQSQPNNIPIIWSQLMYKFHHLYFSLQYEYWNTYQCKKFNKDCDGN